VVVSRPFEDISIKNGKASFQLPPLSFAAMTLRLG
jgi:hypothetical protein